MDGTLAELKGFEIKRRGELKLIKLFQGGVFKSFLGGKTLEECYNVVGGVANHWLEVLYTKGRDLEDEDVFDLVSENKNMSKAMSEYGSARSTSITTAKRLGQFLGNDMIKDKGLSCRFIIAKKPEGASVSDRAIPVAIFSAEEAVKKHYIRKWTKDTSLEHFDVRSLVDWDYYIGRLASAIQKIITIPAAFQGVQNPCPTIAHPDWLHKKLRDLNSAQQQRKMKDFFSAAPVRDIEDIGSSTLKTGAGLPTIARVKRKGADDEKSDDTGPFMIDEATEVMAAAAISAAAAEYEEEEEKDGVCPDEDDDYEGWLAYHKKQWKALRARKKAAKALAKQDPYADIPDDDDGTIKADPKTSLKTAGGKRLDTHLDILTPI
jgi:DNA polymerase epsilon subunit 1